MLWFVYGEFVLLCACGSEKRYDVYASEELEMLVMRMVIYVVVMLIVVIMQLQCRFDNTVIVRCTQWWGMIVTLQVMLMIGGMMVVIMVTAMVIM
ncbi:hypothetical protein E2C01_086534 [Portunus trituberculatus]|uniref:Uncharacterized protein n=1 Tax=Portunus trituberculatus TaxID=210409 RepID=A0A5B7JGL9_PORTR|nr:hypothetical protein [Portunus trituberculatus]